MGLARLCAARQRFGMLSSVSRGHAALRGGVAVLLGIAFLVWPDVGTGTFVALFALYCLVDAGVALTRLANATPRWPLALRTFVDLAAAFVASPTRTAPPARSPRSSGSI
jgi:uncharacterized membrane protein HdeD (DUF308 family)